jgi:hypothetical protein
LVAADAGATIGITVTLTKAAIGDVDFASFTYSVAGPQVTAPAVLLRFSRTVKPKILGVALIGKTLTASTGTWKPAPAFAFQWKANGKPIAGATRRTLRLTKADAGKKISVMVVAAKAGYSSVTLTSAATAKVAKAFTRVPRPTITGTAKLGGELTALHGTWKPKATKYEYKWYRNGVAVRGRSGAVYKLTKADLGKKITVVVIAEAKGYGPQPSAASKAVAVKR